jgi:ABC-type Fe3+ transport system permease subunit
MLDVMHYIFSSFWVWAGTVILLGVFGFAVAFVVALVRG